tara:strand:+ start:455 stop:1120 length:666 start_codon:yes stop_codon:yes gene_type:complete
MENKVIKNMEYFKKKNNIPGIDSASEAGLRTTDGRATSAPFQMKEEDSPNKFIFGGLGQALGINKKIGNMFGLGNADQQVMGMANQAVNLGQGAAGQQMNPGNPVVQPVQQPVQSPMQAEGDADDEQSPTSKGSIAGQYLKMNKDESGKVTYTYEDTDGSTKTFTDPNNVIKLNDEGMVIDNDYTYNVDKDGRHIITGLKEKPDQDEGFIDYEDPSDPDLG